MNYNIDDIKVYLNSFQLNEIGEFTDRDVEDYVWRMNEKNVPDFSYDTGISKFVIIPNHLDYVIKIPFTGSYQRNFNYSYESIEDIDDYSFISFCNSGTNTPYDYIAREIETYNYYKNTEENFLNFLLPSEKIGECCKINIYIQPKAEVYCDSCVTPTQKSINIINTMKEQEEFFYYSNLPDDWIALCLETLNGDKNKLCKLLDFFDEFNDLHTANIGYYNGHPVIIDYAGFHD